MDLFPKVKQCFCPLPVRKLPVKESSPVQEEEDNYQTTA